MWPPFRLGLAPFSPSTVNIKAGKLLLSQVKEFIHQKVDFAFESTLSGRSYVALIKDVKRKGYSVTVFFLWILDIKLARERIKQRVKSGGHDVPFQDVKRRFQRSRVNFLELYEPLCDSWILFDNASGKPQEIAQKDRGHVKILNREYYCGFTKD
ncbi:MAG: zeta toxin family protein [Candidatus Omnitrophica bacterium]|nr:zeta toxin family protein [Candidatus Omnitrophota bacterium]